MNRINQHDYEVLPNEIVTFQIEALTTSPLITITLDGTGLTLNQDSFSFVASCEEGSMHEVVLGFRFHELSDRAKYNIRFEGSTGGTSSLSVGATENTVFSTFRFYVASATTRGGPLGIKPLDPWPRPGWG